MWLVRAHIEDWLAGKELGVRRRRVVELGGCFDAQ